MHIKRKTCIQLIEKGSFFFEVEELYCFSYDQPVDYEVLVISQLSLLEMLIRTGCVGMHS